MARITRKELKSDKFALEVGHTVEYVTEHRKQIVRYTAIAVAVALVGGGVYFYQRHQQTVREQALSWAILIEDAPVGQAAEPGAASFPSQEAKDQAASKAFRDLISKHEGSREALIAHYYLGVIAARQGKFAEAEKELKQPADRANRNYSSLARLSLAQIYFAEGRAAEGEKLLRALIEHPTMMVSKEQATITLAEEIARNRPKEARKLLEPLRTARSPVSQNALNALSGIPAE